MFESPAEITQVQELISKVMMQSFTSKGLKDDPRTAYLNVLDDF